MPAETLAPNRWTTFRYGGVPVSARAPEAVEGVAAAAGDPQREEAAEDGEVLEEVALLLLTCRAVEFPEAVADEGGDDGEEDEGECGEAGLEADEDEGAGEEFDAGADGGEGVGVGDAALDQAGGEGRKVHQLAQSGGGEKSGKRDAGEQQCDVGGGPVHVRSRRVRD